MIRQIYLVYIAAAVLAGCTHTLVSQKPGESRVPASVCSDLFDTPNGGPKSKAPVFSDPGIVNLKLSAEFEKVDRANEGGNWTGEDRSDPRFWSKGTLEDLSKPGRVLKVAIRARGMSSADDVAFPKLRVEIDDSEKLDGTIFKSARNWRVNTHGDTNPQSKHSGMGRLLDDRAPFREALVYDMARAMSLAAPATRRAKIHYFDTETKQDFERQALLIEPDKKIAERYGAKVDDSFPEVNKIDIRIGARFHLFNILVGNEDVGLKLKNEPSMMTEFYRPFFNTTVFKLPNGEQFPIVFDFDMATLVSGWEAHFLRPAGGFGITDARVRRSAERLAEFRARLSQAEYQRAIADYATAKNYLHTAIENNSVDHEGKKLAYEHIDIFEKATSVLSSLPMLAVSGARFYSKAEATDEHDALKASINGPGTLRPGTPIRLIKNEGPFVQVEILDMKFDLKNEASTIGYIEKGKFKTTFDLPRDLQGYTDDRNFAGAMGGD